MTTMRMRAPTRNEVANAPHIIAPGERRMFRGTTDIALELKTVHAFGMHEHGSMDEDNKACALVATELRIPDVTRPTRDRPIALKAVAEGVYTPAERCREILATEAIAVVLHNPHGVVAEGAVVAMGVGGPSSSPSPNKGKDFFFGLHPWTESPHEHRIRLAPHAEVVVQASFECRCDITRITMRSDSRLDVIVHDVTLANMSLAAGMGEVPVEFFRDGVALSTYTMFPENRAAVTLKNASGSPRWVEIDFELAPVESPCGAP